MINESECDCKSHQWSHNICNVFRKVKNKNTGLDLTIPTYRKTTGLLSATVEYNIVVVSTLQCFKTAKHKESDVVQFAVSSHCVLHQSLYC